ncbi:MAG TPA: type II secretion system protein GspE, partial [Gammaproteobacteria bacterium]|nr:type II secretion system protein GspE [Gammaproteobacteria bacterium]
EQIDPAVRKVLGVAEDEVFFKGSGCDLCHDTGVSGRMAVYELLVMTAELRRLLAQRVPADSIGEQAVRDGMTPLTQSALKVARERKIPLSEVYRVRL